MKPVYSSGKLGKNGGRDVQPWNLTPPREKGTLSRQMIGFPLQACLIKEAVRGKTTLD